LKSFTQSWAFDPAIATTALVTTWLIVTAVREHRRKRLHHVIDLDQRPGGHLRRG
jgi:hypothetical protein